MTNKASAFPLSFDLDNLIALREVKSSFSVIHTTSLLQDQRLRRESKEPSSQHASTRAGAPWGNCVSRKTCVNQPAPSLEQRHTWINADSLPQEWYHTPGVEPFSSLIRPDSKHPVRRFLRKQQGDTMVVINIQTSWRNREIPSRLPM